MTPAGVCRFCGCSEFDACVTSAAPSWRGCHWVDVGRRVCSVCAPAAKAEGGSLRGLRRAGYPMTPAWLRAHHHGFIVGWFAVTPRSRYGRNPYVVVRSARPQMAAREAWALGQRAGAEAGRVYQTTFGAIPNEPRRSVLRVGG